MLHVKIRGTRKSIEALAFLDDGSSVTMIDSAIIDEIGAEKSRVNVTLKGLGGDQALVHSHFRVNLRIQGAFKEFPLKNVLIVDNLTLPSQSISSKMVEECAQRTGIRLTPYDGTPIMLIGQEHSEMIVTREFRSIDSKSLLVSRSLLG
ncbi:hypothetical protein QAD02_013410 [Eretmocerus hayati]|uniref:Uncharacterized protein n=1 Tax=Eretmocerus hayati TaxID=131215 RepID=A0ACC2P3E0_9HYME|nr:hypothetical protein QAD02_013410 [Eretmocerus hayati]